MANVFNVDNAPITEPTRFVVGDFVMWKRKDLASDYPTSDFTAQYVIRVSGADEDLIIPQHADTTSDYYLFKLSSAVSSTLVAGVYRWQLEVIETATSEKAVVMRGSFDVAANLDNNRADVRQHAEIMLDKINSLLEGRADTDVAEYSVQGRSLTKLSFNELMNARDRYAREVVAINNKAAIAQGRKTKSTVKVRFV